MEKIFAKLKIKDDPKDFFGFAKNYFDDGKHFFEKEDFLKAFEAFVIAWAYVDAGLKLDFFEIPEDMKENFTF